MKTFKIFILPLLGMILLTSKVQAQKGDFKIDLKYNYSFPVSNFNKDLISNSSPRGFAGNIMYQFNPKWSAGLGFGYQDFYQKYPRDIYSMSKTEDVSAVVTNSIQSTPVMVQAEWMPVEGARIKPYITFGAGANLVNFDQYFGQFSSTATSVNFIAQAGAGINIPFDRAGNYSFVLGGNYNYAPYKKYGYKDLSNVNVNAGFSIKMK